MRMLKLFVLSLLVLSAPVVCAQTTQTWFQLVQAESGGTTLTFPTAVIIRWCDAATRKTCSPVEAIAANTSIVAYCPSVAQCNTDDATDGLSTITKDIEILETTAVQTVVNNGTSLTVPAVPVPNWPAFAFVPGTSYWTLVANLPPTPSGALQGLLKIYNGNTLVASFVCTMGSTMIVTSPAGVTPQSLAAPFGCVAQPVTNQ